MKNKYAIITAIEDYHDKRNLGKVHYALNDATGIKSALENLGYENDNIELLTNNLATKTTILDKIKKISKYAREGESILFYYAGHGFYSDGRNLLSCVDTSLSSLHDSCVSLQDILGIFNNSKSNQIMLFLDCCHSGLEFDSDVRSPIALFSPDDLKYEYSDSEYLSGFSACKGDEKSNPDSENKHGAWSYFLIQALNGNVEDIYKEGLLFSDDLQKYLKNETYNRIKRITTDKRNQTPIQFGKNTDKFIVADVSEILSKKIVSKASDSIKFEKITILNVEEDYVKYLPGFIKGKHKEPKEISDYHENWIKSIAQKLLEDEINEIGNGFREILKLKRNQIISTNVDEGIGEIITTEFDYYVEVYQSDESPNIYILKRSIENFKNSEIIYSDRFNEVFDDYFDEVELKTNKKIDVESLIDKVEDIDDEDIISVSYDYSDTSKCTVTIPSISQEIFVQENYVIVKSRNKQSPIELIDNFKECYKQLASKSIQYLLE